MGHGLGILLEDVLVFGKLGVYTYAVDVFYQSPGWPNIGIPANCGILV